MKKLVTKQSDSGAYERILYAKKYIKYLMLTDDGHGPYPVAPGDAITYGYNVLAKSAHPQEPNGEYMTNFFYPSQAQA